MEQNSLLKRFLLQVIYHAYLYTVFHITNKSNNPLENTHNGIELVRLMWIKLTSGQNYIPDLLQVQSVQIVCVTLLY